MSAGGSEAGRFERHPLNAPGPFYVARGCCTLCQAPLREAPGLMAKQVPGTNFGCYFASQPSTPSELAQVYSAFRVSCIGALRYGGNDPRILDELKRHASEGACDSSPECRKPLFVSFAAGLTSD